MDTVKLDNKKECRMIAHRGLCSIERENTLPAFVAAGNRSYYGIETDVHVTSDGEFILIHDHSTGRLADGPELIIEETTFARLREARLTDTNGQIGRIDLRLPSLEEYITVCARYDKIAVLEVKGIMTEAQLTRMVERIRAMNYLDQMVFISFYMENMIILRHLLPEQKLMYLSGVYNPELLADLITYRLEYDAVHHVLTPEIVQELHANGIEVNVWTVDDLAMAARFLEMGVDYITTNCLE